MGRRKRIGTQTTTYSYTAPYEFTEGQLAADFADSYGMPPHQWQRTVLDDWLAVESDGTLVNSLCLMTCPRQNGKTGICVPREDWGLRYRNERILHTAQEYQTSRVAFDRLREKFGSCKHDINAKYPELNRLVDRYTTSAGQMILDLKDGGHIEFRTRGNSGDMGRGGTFDVIVIDEAQSYTDEQDAALSPLNSAAPSGSPQTILMGTVPDPRKPHKGEVFMRLHDMSHADPYVGMCAHEWGTDEVGDVMDEERWYETNPSLGMNLLISGLRKDSKSMSAERPWRASTVSKARSICSIATESKYFDRSLFQPAISVPIAVMWRDTSRAILPHPMPEIYDLHDSCTLPGISSNSKSLAMFSSTRSRGPLTYTVR